MMDEFREYLIELGLSESSIRQYISSVRRSLQMKSITAHLFDNKKSASTKNIYWCALKKWAEFKEDMELLLQLNKPSVKQAIKSVGTKLPSKTTPLTDSEYSAFMEVLAAFKDQEGWIWPVISLMIALGLRAGVDLCGLRRDALVEAQSTGTITLWTKRGKVRSLPIAPVKKEVEQLLEGRGWEVLAEILVDSKNPGTYTHRRTAYMLVVKAVKAIAEKAGLDPTLITTHRFRHNFGKFVYEQSDHDLLLTQKALGHSSPNTTQIYVKADEEKLTDVLAERKQ